jgi:pyruvate kinase
VNHRAVEKLLEDSAVNDGDLVLVTKGDFVNVHGGTNTLKIVKVGDVIR